MIVLEPEPQKKVTRRYSEDSDIGSDDGFAKLANQFSFIERATQTPLRQVKGLVWLEKRRSTFLFSYYLKQTNIEWKYRQTDF